MITDVFVQSSLSWLLLAAMTALSIYWLWTKNKQDYMKYNIPPFPVPPAPIVGHLFKMGFNFRNIFNEWREKAGDIFSMDMKGQLNIVVCGYDNIKEVLVKNADYVTNTPENYITTTLLNERDKGIIQARDGNWKEQRTTSLGILRDFGMGKNFLAEKIQEEVAVYTKVLEDLTGKPKDVRILTNVSISNVICAIIVGKRFEHDDPYFVRFVKLMNDLLTYSTRAPLLAAFPMLYYLPGDFFKVKKLISCAIEVNDMFAKAHIKKNKEIVNENEEPGNFIAAYLQEMTKKAAQGKATRLNEENLIAIIRILFIAGTETTSTTILWCILYMLHHPEIQEKVYKEIEEHVGTERLPNMSDKPKLTYLNAVIMETQRMASLVPIGTRREVSETFEAGGYTFPKGSAVWPFLDSVLYDKKIWGDPENFRPERFVGKNAELLNPETLIPFSMGRRICLGQGLAKMELYLFLSSLFQTFRFDPEDKSSPLPTTEAVVGGTCVPHPFQVRFVKRK